MITGRPPFQLRSLPIPIRWEVTRRHPYYQVYWQSAGQFDSSVPLRDDDADPLPGLATWVLAQIGVTGRPPPPQTDFDNLGEADLNLAWLSGAVHPVTLRGLVSIALAWLPKDAAHEVAELFQLAAQSDVESELPKQKEALMRLPSLDHSALDSFPDAPFVSINPAASERQVIAALNPLMKQWKAERGLSQKRDRSENFEQFLRVWDLREGWNAGRYDRQASTLQAVAAELDLPLGTITKQYRRAFELITGHRYSPQAWVSFFGVLKLSAFAAVQGDSVSRRRPLVSPITREVPESRLRGPGNDSPGVTQNVSVSAESDAQPLVDQIIALIKAGETDDTILERTELGDRARPAIEELRSHFGTPRTSSRK